MAGTMAGTVRHKVRAAMAFLGLDGARCPLCGVARAGDMAGEPCPTCASALAPRQGGYCPRCGGRFGMNSYEPMVCSECRDEPPPWDALYYHAGYEGRLRDLILTYKFASGIQHARLFRQLALAAYREKHEAVPDVVVPVPLHVRRLLWRGFNQSLELARLLARAEGLPLAPKAMARIRHTPPQSTLGPDERATNLKDAFTADEAQVSGKNVLLVDDVVTTGATLRECTHVLRKSGAARVDVLVLARV